MDSLLDFLNNYFVFLFIFGFLAFLICVWIIRWIFNLDQFAYELHRIADSLEKLSQK